MPSEIGRGIRLGIGFALGVGLVMLLFVLGLSMCAGHLHQRVIEQMEKMMQREGRSAPQAQDNGFPLQPKTNFSDSNGFRGQSLRPPREAAVNKLCNQLG